MNKSSNGDIILIENGIYSGSNNTNININKDLVILGKDTIIDAINIMYLPYQKQLH